jgi:hypothetical protein
MKGKKITVKERLALLEKNAAERRKLCKSLCSHLEKGLSMDCFPEVHYQTIERYIKSFPEEFPREEIELALVKGKHWWEEIGRLQSNGNCIGNSRSWYYNMVNRFGWHEKAHIESEHKGSVNVSVVSYASANAASVAQDAFKP